MSDDDRSYEDLSSYVLTPEAEQELLDRQNECTFMWTTKAGEPVGVIMNFVHRDGEIWLTLASQRKRVAAVRRDPRVAVAITSKGSGIPTSRTVTYKGTCTIHDDAETKAWFYPALAAACAPASPTSRPPSCRSLTPRCGWCCRWCRPSASVSTARRCGPTHPRPRRRHRRLTHRRDRPRRRGRAGVVAAAAVRVASGAGIEPQRGHFVDRGVMGDLDGKVAAVTGGTRGIGLAIAKAFHREGASVVINGRSPEKGAAALEEMGGGDRVHYIAADVKTREGVESIIDGTVERFGRIDILVNNAGGAANHAPVAQLTDEAFGDALVWNLWSTFWGMRARPALHDPAAVGPHHQHLVGRGQARQARRGHYVTAKHAINGLTKSCAQEVGTLGITVNALCPGAIETDVMMAEGPGQRPAMGLTYQGLLDWFAEEAAIKRLNTCEEVAEVAVLVASDIGGGITGSQISIDGGTAAY